MYLQVSLPSPAKQYPQDRPVVVGRGTLSCGFNEAAAIKCSLCEYIFLFLVVLGVELKYSTTELHPKPLFFILRQGSLG